VFLVIEARTASPLMPLGLLRKRNVASANLVGVLWASAMFAWFFLSALYMQLVLGYTPLEVGLAFLPANLIMGAFSLGLSAKLVMRFGIMPPLVVGLLVAAAVETVILDAIQESVARIAEETGIDEDAPLALVAIPETETGVALANAIAPEHLEILTEDAELLTQRVTTAGCVFVGERSATAFGDYAAGSNHVLPTGGAGRFQGPLGPGVFRRRISTVEITQDAARALAPTVATLARAEGFPLHADSALARGRPAGEAEEQPV